MRLPPNTSVGLVVSATGHAALVAWGLFTFAPHPLEASPQDAMPVDIISTSDFSKMTKGTAQAPKSETPKPLVDKQADEEKPAPELTEEIAKKTEVKTAAAPPEPPPVPRSRPEPKPEPEPEAKPEPKPDEIAETLKKQQAQKQKQAEAAKARAEQRRRQEEEARKKRRFDADKVAALLDRRNPQRVASTGREVNTEPSLGRPDSFSLQMSANELDALRARLANLWNPPAGASNPDELVVRVRIRLTRDGRLDGQPQVLSRGNGPLYNAARDSALRALFRGQPYDMLSPGNYEIWRDVEITFDPREMFRG